jgi:hypothetical protein
MIRIGTTDPKYVMAEETKKAEVIVQMSTEEWRAFELLMASVDGDLPNDFGSVHHFELGYNLEPVFRAILLWVQLRFKISAFERKVIQLKELMEALPE